MAEERVIRIKCPNLSCTRILAVPDHARGQVVRCRICGSMLKVPTRGGSPAAPPPPAEASEDAA